ncbi:MAG: phosphoenolpyruvate synthase [Pseudomonadota bacterium]
MSTQNPVIWFRDLRRSDVAQVGGKNASLGEMVANLAAQDVRVPDGFATTADAFRRFVIDNDLTGTITSLLEDVAHGRVPLAEAGRDIRRAFLRAEFPADIAAEICNAYHILSAQTGKTDIAVAVRSSATAEDLPDASFAGQQETFLNIRGEAALLEACRKCYASLFTDRAISYRTTKGFDHLKVALSIGVQRMVRSDTGASGVMFSIDTESGFDKVALINAAWGLGENVVQGAVNPDEYEVYKPFLNDPAKIPVIGRTLGSKMIKMIYADDPAAPTRNVPTSRAERAAFVLTDADILTLARYALTIENHYGMPMDMEWAKDGETGELFIVQARPETVQSRKASGMIRSCKVSNHGKLLTKGLSIGEASISGPVCVIENARDIARFVDGAVLVTSTTDPDWVPVMKRAAAIVTDHGGRTSHAAIVSRELGLPAIVGTGNATEILHDQQEITVSCSEGAEGFIYQGRADISVREIDPAHVETTRTQIMLNLANPSAAFRWWRLPVDGVGLARMEFVVSNHVKIHPMALLNFDSLQDETAKAEIAQLTRGYDDKAQYFVDHLALGLARITAPFYPKPVIVRMSDFKTNEYAGLIGGKAFEPAEENPMIGFRGASRYYSPAYRDGFALECRAIRKLRNIIGFDNVVVMIPFCRSLAEADKVLAIMAENDLTRGDRGLQIYVMGEIPANAILAEKFATRFDGFSIGSNDLTQLTLGVDRDSEALADLFDEEDEAVKWMIHTLIEGAHAGGAKIGLCGEAPSSNPAFARFLVDCGIDSISVSPDSFMAVKHHVAQAESRQTKAP